MRTKFNLIIAFVFGMCLFVKASPNHPMIVIREAEVATQALSQEQKGYTFYLLTKLTSKIRKEFDCANVLEMSEIAMFVGYARQAALLGNEEMGQRGLDMVKEAVSAEYVVYVKVNTTPSAIFATVWLSYPRRCETLVMKTGSGSGTGFLDQLIDDFVSEMAYHEICPYKGSVDLGVNTTRKTNKTDRIDVECNQQFQQKVVIQKFNLTEKTEWKLTKNGKSQGTGEMSYYKTEERIHIEEDPCFPCTSGRMAGRTSNDEYFEIAEGSGISYDARNAIISPGSGREEVFSDVRFKINFLKNGTYTLTVKAATVNIPAKVKIDEVAKGSCDVKNEHKTDSYYTKISVESVLGPFSGTPLQKKLKGNGAKPINQGDETGTTTYNFELNR
jgi:hypothetical protein